MKRKIDSVKGRLIHTKRLPTAEPVFANICSTLRLNIFTLRGKLKVNIQWLLYCTGHILLKVHRYGYGYAEEEIREGDWGARQERAYYI